MGKNAQRRRQAVAWVKFERNWEGARGRSTSLQLSRLSQEYQAEHPEIIFNRATRRFNRVPTWLRVRRG